MNHAKIMRVVILFLLILTGPGLLAACWAPASQPGGQTLQPAGNTPVVTGVTYPMLASSTLAQTQAAVQPRHTSTLTPVLLVSRSATATGMAPQAAFLTAHESMIVRGAPDVNAGVSSRIPSGHPYPVLGGFGDWYLIDLQNGQSGWVNASGHRYELSSEVSLIPTLHVTLSPYMTPTPRCAPQDVQDVTQALDDAQSTLVTFFDLLSKKDYAGAAEFFGGDYYELRDFHPLLDPNDSAALFQRGCELDGYQCLPVRQVINARALSAHEYEFMVEFRRPDGSPLVIGPCCGANPTEQPERTRWKYRVVLDCHRKYYVMDMPPMHP